MDLAVLSEIDDCAAAPESVEIAVRFIQEWLQANSMTPEATTGEDQRAPRAPRRAVVVEQLIAPYYGRTFPEESAFRKALCLNVSQTGIAMLLPMRPDWQDAVIGLNLGGRTKYMLATVARKVPIQFGGRTHHVVGMRFKGPIERD